jgi:hypothetical protein
VVLEQFSQSLDHVGKRLPPLTLQAHEREVRDHAEVLGLPAQYGARVAVEEVVIDAAELADLPLERLEVGVVAYAAPQGRPRADGGDDRV